MAKKKIFITPPEYCDLCDCDINNDFVDGRVHPSGAWATMCLGCHVTHGVGLGKGKGQMYHRFANGVWEKIDDD